VSVTFYDFLYGSGILKEYKTIPHMALDSLLKDDSRSGYYVDQTLEITLYQYCF